MLNNVLWRRNRHQIIRIRRKNSNLKKKIFIIFWPSLPLRGCPVFRALSRNSKNPSIDQVSDRRWVTMPNFMFLRVAGLSIDVLGSKMCHSILYSAYACIGRTWTYYYFLPITKSITVGVLRHQAGPSAQLKTSIPRILIGYEAQNRAYLAHLGMSHLCHTLNYRG